MRSAIANDAVPIVETLATIPDDDRAIPDSRGIMPGIGVTLPDDHRPIA
jgi:hypothetical protein